MLRAQPSRVCSGDGFEVPSVAEAALARNALDRRGRPWRLVLESARGECAPGQYEIVVAYDEALRAADAAAFYKTGAKQAAAQEGVALTFMAKYDEAQGSCCHLHVSLRRPGGEPVPAGDGLPGRPDLAGTSAMLRGLGRPARLSAGAHPAVRPDREPYNRLRPGTFAPSARLPASLGEAADLFEGNEVARQGLGNGVVDALVAAARAELLASASAVTDWERRRGFERR